MQRFFVPAELLQDSTVVLPREVAHHAGSVLRLRQGAEVLLLDGLGEVCRCRLESLGRSSATVRVLERWREAEEAFPIHLLQALPKGEKMELILQKGTELGLVAFTPLLTGRTIPERSESRGLRQQERWERIVREAARQCRRPRLPRVAPPVRLAAGLGACTEELRLILWEDESRPLAEVLGRTSPRSAAILIGPEGGFAPEEVEVARGAGFIPVRVGPRILRTETAGLAMASILQFLYGDLGTSQPPLTD